MKALMKFVLATVGVLAIQMAFAMCGQGRNQSPIDLAGSLEAHLVHEDQNGNLAVVAVLYREGAADPLLSKLWAAVPATEGETAALPAGMDVAALLPSDRDYYRYNGSLTTSPCSEGVWWLRMKEHPTVSSAQAQQFAEMLGFANNRPLQPVNARVVAQ